MHYKNANKLSGKTQLIRTFSILTLILLWAALDHASLLATNATTETSVVLTDPGASIYKEKCANCHGNDGQGVETEYDEPLFGDRSIKALTRLIRRTMPEDEPDNCVGEEAHQVADYIFHEFYSLKARLKKGLVPRIELSRLTVPQYRNAVADLMGHFTPPVGKPSGKKKPNDKTASSDSIEAGLRAQYFQSKGMSKANKLQLERIDHRIDFDFGEGSPTEDITADQFSIIWEGSLSAGETGHYEFRIRTQNGIRLYLNSENTGKRGKMRDDSSLAGQAALIDGWVSSGKMRDHTARVFLLGGRQYPLRLEFFKYKEKTASIKMEWKRPHGAWSVFDHHFSNTAPSARTFVVETPFPADDRSLGYERGNAISQEWHSATTHGAIDSAAEIINRLPLLAGYRKDTTETKDLLKDFVVRFATVAFRRPLTSVEDQLYREALFSKVTNPEAAVRWAVLLILKSPNFLYTNLPPTEDTPNDYVIASKLSFALWDSIPDQTLINAARNGKLTTTEQITSQARRMMNNPRTRAKIRRFFNHWLELEERDLAKDKDMFPEYDETTISDLRHSLDLFLDQVVWSEESDYRQLLLADHLILNESLLNLYRPDKADSGHSTLESKSDSPPIADFESVVFSPDRRAGVLTHPYLLSAFAYHNNSSPIHRGVFLTRNIMGRGLRPPPKAVAFKNEEFASDITMREKITKLTRDTACMACHSFINPLGFALENFDAIGRWRTLENNKPIDSRSEYIIESGDTLEVRSARDIAEFAVSNESAHNAFVTQMFHHLVMQSPYAYGPYTVDELRKKFAENNFNIQNLVSDIAVMATGHRQTELTIIETKP